MYRKWAFARLNIMSSTLGDLGLIPGRVIPKTQKLVLNASLLNTQHYKVGSNPRKRVALSLTTWCSSYRKGSLLVTLDNFTYLQSIRLQIIYICCHPQTDCFVPSELSSVAKYAGRSKPGSKPVQLSIRLSFRPLGHKTDHVG